MKYAYGRVSSADQNLNRQIDSFIANGVPESRIFTDKKSGKDFERENYTLLISKLKKGDLLVIMSIDRLGRNYDMIITEWRRITQEIGADILVLDMPILDTRSRADNLTGKLISDIVLQLLSYVAQKERENIKARQREGIAAAKRRGVRFGRPQATLPDGFAETVLAYKQRAITLEQAMSRHKIKRAAFYTKMRRCLISLDTSLDSGGATDAEPAQKNNSKADLSNRDAEFLILSSPSPQNGSQSPYKKDTSILSPSRTNAAYSARRSVSLPGYAELRPLSRRTRFAPQGAPG